MSVDEPLQFSSPTQDESCSGFVGSFAIVGLEFFEFYTNTAFRAIFISISNVNCKNIMNYIVDMFPKTL